VKSDSFGQRLIGCEVRLRGANARGLGPRNMY